MFSKQHRLAKTQEVKQALARGRHFSSSLFTVKFLPTAGLPRFTVIVSTKVAKKAVTRNRLKRILREFARTRLNRFARGDYAIIVKPLAAKRPEANVLPDFAALVKKHGLLTH